MDIYQLIYISPSAACSYNIQLEINYFNIYLFLFSQVMELGSSEHWSEAMKIMTGGATNKMDAGPILEYFEPLLNFLQEQNQNETLGWISDDPTICP